MPLKHTKVSAAGASADPAKVGGNDWNDDHIVDAGGMTMTTDTSVPATPAAGKLVLFSRESGGSGMLSYVGPDGRTSTLQPSFTQKKIGMIAVIGGTTAFSTIGLQFGTPTLVARTATTTSFFTSLRRVGVTSSTTVGTSAILSLGVAIAQYWRGNAPNCGGFRFVTRYGCSDVATVTGARSFVGLAGGILGNGDPSQQVNLVGVGSDSGDTTLSIFVNDGAGTATKIPLGANFPDHTLSVDLYELVLFCPPNGTSIAVEVTRLNTGHVARTTLTTDLPPSGLLLTPFLWRNNGTNAQAVAFDIQHFYLETDY